MDVKKAIVLDLDNTLICGVPNGRNAYTMFLRPGIDKLISKLQEAKARGIDIILCTTGTNEWLERLLALRPEFRKLFTKQYTKDNSAEWQNVEYKDFPIEAALNGFSSSIKPVTTWGYNSVLFIDDSNAAEGEMQRNYADTLPNSVYAKTMSRKLKELVEKDLDGKEDLANVIESLPKDISDKLPSRRVDTTFFNVPYYYMDLHMIKRIINLRSDPDVTPENLQKIEEYITHANNDPGCRMICCEIDKFMEKELAPGLTMPGEEHEQEAESYKNKTWEMECELPDTTYDAKEEIDKYMAQDRQGPYLEILPERISIKDAVSDLIRQAGVIENVGIDPEGQGIDGRNLN